MLLPPYFPRSAPSLFDLCAAGPGTIHRILRIALEEWSFFGGSLQRGNRTLRRGNTETARGYYQRVGEYWTYGTGTNLDGRDTEHAWSATLISYVMRKAGVSDRHFRRSIRHSEYIHQAIQNRVRNVPDAAFRGWRLNEHRLKEGDLVCYSRQSANMTYDKAIRRDRYTSHADIVVYVRPGEVGVIGGNVSDSVTLKMLSIDAGGRLADNTQSWFAVLENLLPLA